MAGVIRGTPLKLVCNVGREVYDFRLDSQCAGGGAGKNGGCNLWPSCHLFWEVLHLAMNKSGFGVW